MSVMNFETQELANLAAALIFAQPAENGVTKENIILALSVLSYRNSLAYQATYNEAAKVSDPEMIEKATPLKFDLAGAKSTLKVFGDNLVSNGGRDYGEKKHYEIIGLFSEMLALLEEPEEEGRADPRLSDYGPQYNYFVGEKYDPNMSKSETFATIRKEINSYLKALPVKAKASVRKTSYNSLRIEITRYDGEMLNVERQHNEVDEPHNHTYWAHEFYNETFKKVLNDVKAIAEAYNYDRSDTQTDFFNVNFYLNVCVDWTIYEDEKSRIQADYIMSKEEKTQAQDVELWDQCATLYGGITA